MGIKLLRGVFTTTTTTLPLLVVVVAVAVCSLTLSVTGNYYYGKLENLSICGIIIIIISLFTL